MEFVRRWWEPVRFGRSADDRVLLGVAGGLAARVGVPSATVRVLLAFLSVVSGIGVVLYLLAFACSTPAPAGAAPQEQDEPGRRLALACFAAAVTVLARRAGLWPGDGIVLPAAAVACGALLLWSRSAPGTADPVAQLAAGRYAPVRVAVGVVLAGGALVAVAADGGLDRVPRTVAALALAAGGAVTVAGPWVASVRRQAQQADRARIRDEEKAAIAAHVHDSVLQSLALIQRAGDDPRRVAVLARRQERELRAFLYGEPRRGDATLAAAMDRMTTDLELDHQVRVDTVVVGDHAMDDASTAVLGAVREAVVNAAKHAGVDAVGVYVEVEPDQITAYVRDTGKGFDLHGVPADRHGVAESIVARIERAGGTTVITTAPGQGTEVELRVPTS